MDEGRKIREQLDYVERDLANAEAYVERNVNVDSVAWLHLGDWRGNSGHPLWMKNHMIPSLKRWKVKKEKALQTLNKKRRERLKDHRQQA
jgi:hypothetical protein